MPGIDKVRLDRSYHQYQQHTPVRRTEGAGPRFPFDPDEKGVIYEPTGAKENAAAKEAAGVKAGAAAKEADSSQPATANASSALTETMTAGEVTGAKKATGPKEEAGLKEPAQSSLTGWLVGLGTRFLNFLRGLWDVVWNGPEKSEAPDTAIHTGEEGKDALSADQTGPVEDISKLAEEKRAETLQQIIADHDMEQLVQFVTEGGTKKPARSTDLLTIYNRYGRVNRIDPSDRKKILEGNFNDIKL